MNDQATKPWYCSKGFLAPLTAAILYALRASGIVDVSSDAAAGTIYQILEFVCIIVAMIGRLLARRSIRIGQAVPSRAAAAVWTLDERGRDG